MNRRIRKSDAWGGLVVLLISLGCGDNLLDSLGATRLDPELIDDLEDGDDRIPSAYNRAGGWYNFNDGSGEQCPGPFVPTITQDPAAPGQWAAFTSGTGFDSWGAGLGLSLAGGGLDVAYDARAFRGVRFWLKGALSGDADPIIRVNFPTTLTSCLPVCPAAPPVAEPEMLGSKEPRPDCLAPPAGLCRNRLLSEGELLDPNCDQHFGTELELSPDWTQHQILFEELRQGLAGTAGRVFDPRTFRDIQFLMPRARSFELWADEIEFVR